MTETEKDKRTPEEIIAEEFPTITELLIAAEATTENYCHLQTNDMLADAKETLEREFAARTLYPDATVKSRRVVDLENKILPLTKKISTIRANLDLHDKQSTPEIDTLSRYSETLRIAVTPKKGIENATTQQELRSGQSVATLIEGSWEAANLSSDDIISTHLAAWLATDSNKDDDDTGTQMVANPTK